jgi:apolipoprotein N-acyltransferase
MPSDLGVPASGGDSQRLRHYIGRTLAAAGQLRSSSPGKVAAPVLVVWPESAAGSDISRGKTLVELHDVATVVDADILFGSDIRELGRELNSLYLVTGTSFDFQRYDKRNLVPFGEYVPYPFGPLFGRKATAGEQDYSPGDRPPLVRWRDRFLGVAICFESILPHHIAEAVRGGAQILVVIANDTWLTPPAHTHHLRLTALRALEAGREALFVSNGGWTAHLSGGQPVRVVQANRPALLVDARLESHVTPWVRWGLLLPLGLVALAIAIRLAGHGVAYFIGPRSTQLPLR